METSSATRKSAPAPTKEEQYKLDQHSTKEMDATLVDACKMDRCMIFLCLLKNNTGPYTDGARSQVGKVIMLQQGRIHGSISREGIDGS